MRWATMPRAVGGAYEPYYAPAVVELSMASGDYFRSIPGVLSPRGLLMVGREDQRAAFDADLKSMAYDPISVDEAVAYMPILRREVVKLAAYAGHAEISTPICCCRDLPALSGRMAAPSSPRHGSARSSARQRAGG